MDQKTLKTLMEKIEQLIVEDDKVVTYKSISKILDIHINTAKQLLYVFAKNYYKSALDVSFLIAGELNDGKLCVCIVPENDLKTKCGNFKNITSKHVYSISKFKQTSEIIAGVDVLHENQQTRAGPITCSDSTLKTEEELSSKISKVSLDSKKQETSTKLILQNKENKNKIVDGFQKRESPKKTETKSESPGKLLRRSPRKTNSIVTNVRKENKSSISALFAAQGKRKKVQTEEKETGGTNENGNKTEVKIIEKPVELLEEEKNKLTNNKKTKKKTDKQNKRKKEDKKRKRIQILSDSEDSEEDIFENIPEDITEQHEQEIVDEEPVVEDLKSDEENGLVENTEVIKTGRIRRRKLVDKHVMNEEGYLETHKEVTYETDSDSEIKSSDKKLETSPKKVKTSPKKAAVSPKKKEKAPVCKKVKVATKQPSLMSFFKKM